MVLPAAAVTVLSWVLCQLGAYRLAYQTNSFWLTETSPKPSASWFSALGDLTHELIRTWTEGANEYDQPQWTLLHLFKGSLYVILTLLATAKATPTFRVIMEVVLYLWCWKSLDPFGICIFAGMILAELSMSATAAPKRTSAVRQVIPIGFAILGLYLCSFPSEYYTEAPWCNQLYQIGLRIFPVGAPQGRYWPGVGAQMLCASILYSPILRTALSHRILRYLGGISLPLYLLHGPLIYSILTYMVYLPGYLFSQPVPVSDPSQEGTTVLLTPGPFHLAIAITLFSIVLLFTGRLWSIYVEPYFGDLTDRIERLAQSYGKTDGMSSNASGPILPVHEKS